MKIKWLCLFILSPMLVKGQESESGIKLVTNFKGFELSYSYPILTKNRYYSFVHSDFSVGMKGNYSWGRYYKSGIALMISPSYMIAFVGKTIHKEDFYSNHKTISVRYQNISLNLPVIAEIPFFKKYSLAAGVFMGFPIMSKGQYNNRKINLSILPDFDKTDWPPIDRPYAKVGFLTKLSIPFSGKENVKHIISLEYLHFTTYTDEAGGLEKWFSLSYMRRNIFTKEKRQKWDRYLMKKYQ